MEKLKQRDDWHQWKKAIEDEMESLMKNKTWILTPLPPGRKAISCKWIFRIKKDRNGEIDKYKARLVAKGFSQEKGFDYNETYAPVAKLVTVRILLALANQFNLYVEQMDVKTAFLNGVLEEVIYMKQPEEFQKNESNLVCKLQKSLYGLKQSPRSWNNRFHNFVVQLGFKRSYADYCLYYSEKDKNVWLLLYVDDILLVGPDKEAIQYLKDKLSKEFDMTDLGQVNHFLGLRIIRDFKNGIIEVDQSVYIQNVLVRFGMGNCKPVSTPMENGLKLSRNEDLKLVTKEPYRELIGCLMYAALGCRPDITFAVNHFSQYQSAPTDEHWTHLKRILRYLKGSYDKKLVFKRTENPEAIIGYADADWANNIDDRKSVSGYIFKIYGSTISWSTKKQDSVALSSTQAEYVALCHAATEGIWLRRLLDTLDVGDGQCFVIYEDNQPCIAVAEEPKEHRKMKHISLKFHFLRDEIAKKTLTVKYIPTGEQLADLLTKALPRIQFDKLSKRIFETEKGC
jgi:hypothetical protein